MLAFEQNPVRSFPKNELLGLIDKVNVAQKTRSNMSRKVWKKPLSSLVNVIDIFKLLNSWMKETSIKLTSVILPWAPEVFLAPFPVSVMSLL